MYSEDKYIAYWRFVNLYASQYCVNHGWIILKWVEYRIARTAWRLLSLSDDCHTVIGEQQKFIHKIPSNIFDV